MNKTQWSMLALAVAVVALVAVQVRAQAKTSAQPAKRFEHACDIVQALPLEPTLEKRSADGWELATTTISTNPAGNSVYFCWKRAAK
jgi:hypothetical protein